MHMPNDVLNQVIDCDWLGVFIDQPLERANHNFVLDCKDQSQLEKIDALIESVNGQQFIINNLDLFSCKYLASKLGKQNISLKFNNPDTRAFLDFISMVANYRAQNALSKMSIVLISEDKQLLDKFPEIAKKINEIKPVIEQKQDNLPGKIRNPYQVDQESDPIQKLIKVNETTNPDLLTKQLQIMKEYNNELINMLQSDVLIDASFMLSRIIDINNELTSAIYAFLGILEVDLSAANNELRIQELKDEEKKVYSILDDKEIIIQSVIESVQDWLECIAISYHQTLPAKTRDLEKLKQHYMQLFDFALAINQSMMTQKKTENMVNIQESNNQNEFPVVEHKVIETPAGEISLESSPSQQEPKFKGLQFTGIQLKTDCFQFLIFKNHTLDLKNKKSIQLLLVLLNIGYLIQADTVRTLFDDNASLKKFILTQVDGSENVKTQIEELASTLLKDSGTIDVLEIIITEEEITQLVSFLGNPGVPEELVPLVAQYIHPIVEEAIATNNKLANKMKHYFNGGYSEDQIIAKLKTSTAPKRQRQQEGLEGDLAKKAQKMDINWVGKSSFFKAENEKQAAKKEDKLDDIGQSIEPQLL